MKNENSLPQTFAIVTDKNRRAGLRVARVFVVAVFEPLNGAEVEEMTNRRAAHYVSFSRMAKTPRALKTKFRACLATRTAPAPLPRRRVRGLLQTAA